MQNALVRKSLVSAVIVLFVGINAMPLAGSLSVERVSIKEQICNFNLADDNTPPVTTISFDPAECDGACGWYVSNVTVTLNATDQDGVNATYYRINNGTWGAYDSPFVISEEGDDILIEFYSVDIYGNIENVKSETLDIDRTPPNMTVEWEAKRIGWRKWQVTFSINITNEPSGMTRIDIYFNDVLQETIVGPGPIYSWSLIICYVPNLTFKFVAVDQACNQAIVIVNGSDINSYPHSQIVNTHQSSNMLFWEVLWDTHSTEIVNLDVFRGGIID